MAKGDSTGIAQQGAQLDPNRNNRFGNPNNPIFGGGIATAPMARGMGGLPQGPGMGQGIASPDPGFIEMLMQQLFGQSKPAGQIDKLRGGINRLKGNNQGVGTGARSKNVKPEMNKNPPRMPMPQSRSTIMPGFMQQAPPTGGRFSMPQPQMADSSAMSGGMPQWQSGMNTPFLQDPNNLMAAMGGQLRTRGFV